MSSVSDAASPPGRSLPERLITTGGTRQRLLEQGLILFGARGYHGVSVRELAAAVGIRASSFYAHFDTKEQLLYELLSAGHQEHRDALRSALLDSDASPMDQVRRLMTAHVVAHATYPLLGRICNREREALSIPNRDRIGTVRMESAQLFFDVIERGVRLGAFEVLEPQLTVSALGAIGIRVAEWWSVDLGYRIDHVAATYARFAQRMLTPDPPDSQGSGS
ncbi:TetR/AcrR family transcriptional regulator [Rhodococcus sp. IEGM1428]|uniref:TetR/AcrR family transcriptional regulator n=1 Tax=Rhodococcus sp. IEGM1428 TaxID=3392191 RepID=UPI003D0F3405